MITKISLAVLVVFCFVSFRSVETNSDLSRSIKIEEQKTEQFLAFKVPGYCRKTQGVTVANAHRKLKRLVRTRKVRVCEVQFSTTKEVNACVNKFVKLKDQDCDGVKNGRDNCPSKGNPDQADSDSNGVGNACTPGVGSATL